MRLYVATKEGTVLVDDLPQEATSRDLTSRVLTSSSSDGGKPSLDAARHYLVCDGRRLKDSGQETSLLSQGVSDGSTVVLFKRRVPPVSTDGGGQNPPQLPSLEQIERVVRAEAERQGREVVTPTQPAEGSRGIAPLETRLHDIMQALQNMSGQGLNDTEMQRHVTQALRTAARLPAGAEPPMNEEVVVPEPNPTHIVQLGDMGFSAAAARRALLLNRNAVNAAANYLLAHGGDGDIEAEPTEQELRQVYRARNVRLAQPRQVEALPELMEQLTAMGFSEAGSRHALVRNDNNLDAALNLLTSMPPGWEPAPEDTAAPTSGAEAAGRAADGAAGAAPREAENDQPAATESGASTMRDAVSGSTEAAVSPVLPGGAGEGAGGLWGEAGASEQDVVNFSDGSAAVAALVEAAARAIEPTVPATGDEAAVAVGGFAGPGDLRYDDAAEVELLLDAERRGVVEVRQRGQEDGHEEGDQEDEGIDGMEDGAAHEEGDGEDYQAVQEDFLRRSEQLLDNMSMMDLQEGMRGIMSALGGGAEGGARMSGALPILSTGSGEGGMDPLRLVDDMRWGNGFPGLLGGLMDENADEGGLDEDDEFNDDDGFHTETTYADEEDDPEEGEADEDDEDEDMEDEEDNAEEDADDDDGIDENVEGIAGSGVSGGPDETR